MKIPESYSVHPISFGDIKPWLLKRHYAHRIPSISYAFGLFDKRGCLKAVCSFGRPVAHFLIKGVLGGKYQDRILELNRLCAEDGLARNTLSYFVSQCLHKLPPPMLIVSYADTSHNHHGYIYQATNWIYTGLSAPFKDAMVRGMENMHHSAVADLVGRCEDLPKGASQVALLRERFGADNVYMMERPRKHRYFYFLGDKRQVRDMKKLFIYKQEPYPKGNNVRYDASAKIATQMVLF